MCTHLFFSHLFSVMIHKTIAVHYNIETMKIL
uniref:Uncharacterized protein n=1 Tax=Anguilla anguilla TaxID=7936 RepID=A0A0E9THE9_ANGAN